MWQGLCNSTVSDRLCPIYWPLQAAAVGLLVWSLFVWTIIWPQQRRAASLLLSAAWAGDIDQQRQEPSSRCWQCHGDSQVTNAVKSTLDSNTDSTLSFCSVMEKEITEHVGLRVTSKRISVFVQPKFSIKSTNLPQTFKLPNVAHIVWKSLKQSRKVVLICFVPYLFPRSHLHSIV